MLYHFVRSINIHTEPTLSSNFSTICWVSIKISSIVLFYFEIRTDSFQKNNFVQKNLNQILKKFQTIFLVFGRIDRWNRSTLHIGQKGNYVPQKQLGQFCHYSVIFIGIIRADFFSLWITSYVSWNRMLLERIVFSYSSTFLDFVTFFFFF